MTAGPSPAHPDPGIRERPLVFVADLDRPAIEDSDLHHLERVLRHRPDTLVTLCDGKGGWRTGTLRETPGELGAIMSAPALDAQITVGVALAKSLRQELIVQKLTELGVDRIVLIRAERSVARWPSGEVESKLARMRRVVRESAMQSRRLRLPVVVGLPTLGEFVTAEQASGGSVALAEPGGGPVDPSTSSTVVVGPEGGWTEDELSLVPARVGLGSGILRVETAAMAVAALLCACRDGWAPPA